MYPLPESFARAMRIMGKEVYEHMWGPKEFAATGTLNNFDVTNRLNEITKPVLLLCGRYDESTPETTAYYQTLFPNAIMKVFKNSAHNPVWTDREEFMETVRDFLNKYENP